MTHHLGTLYVVATPIGNLEDLSPRVKRTLLSVDIIAAEDTRETLKLLRLMGSLPEGSHGPFPKIVSYHDFNEDKKAEELVALLSAGASMALVSDAGTPAISDPGYRIVTRAHEKQIPVVPVPGPSAVTALLSASGLPTNRFMFVGFLPQKTRAKYEEMQSWQRDSQGITVVFFESMRRLEKTLQALLELYPQASVTIGRELTKVHEEVLKNTVADTLHWLRSLPTRRGEVAVAIYVAPRSLDGFQSRGDFDQKERIVAEAQAAFRKGEPLKTLLQKYRDSGIPRSELYGLLLDAKKGR